MKTYTCKTCNTESRFKHSKSNIYCSIKCQSVDRQAQFISKWLNGDETGTGVNGTKLSIKRYLLAQQDNKCAYCGITEHNGKPIVLELEHKDGNSQNNLPKNLCMICPNCHSQTPTYKGANRGNGRHARRVRYSLDKSY